MVCGGPGLPDGIDRGYYVRPTVFSDVTNDMSIAEQEILDPCCHDSYDTRKRRFRSPTIRRMVWRCRAVTSTAKK